MQEDEFLASLNRAFNGDHEAQTSLYVQYEQHILRVARYRLRVLHIDWAIEPDEIYASIFLRLFHEGRARIQFQNAVHFSNYLEKAARNQATQVLRSVMRAKCVRLEECTATLISPTDGVADVEFEDELAATIAKLTPRERGVSDLLRSNMTWRQIGTQLGITADAARKVYERARKRLRLQVLFRNR